MTDPYSSVRQIRASSLLATTPQKDIFLLFFFSLLAIFTCQSLRTKRIVSPSSHVHDPAYFLQHNPLFDFPGLLSR